MGGGGGGVPTYMEHKCAINTNRHAAFFYFYFLSPSSSSVREYSVYTSIKGNTGAVVATRQTPHKGRHFVGALYLCTYLCQKHSLISARHSEITVFNALSTMTAMCAKELANTVL